MITSIFKRLYVATEQLHLCLQHVQAFTEYGNLAYGALVFEIVFCMGAGADTYSHEYWDRTKNLLVGMTDGNGNKFLGSLRVFSAAGRTIKGQRSQNLIQKC